uniref:Methyltransferase type 11 domain-containing protein n=1 Tax=Fibrocapsa japonica TaxID=94617 RepID=A0A7S2UZT8_9STRA|mmetsp:Transcript_22323/g.32416  ORF Transcript_22323/g.32416 Transcript_22323/m.32416 type:complete len:148 (+) Transcript_22323:3-446(+)
MLRRLIKSGQYDRVIGADFSEPMLLETARRIREEGLEEQELIRLDVAQLPFKTTSLDAVHAGAALHCYPRIREALSEIHRVLKPGGKFYASTFLRSATINVRQQSSSGFYFFEIQELKDLMVEAGFELGNVLVEQKGRGCAIIKCTK